MNACDCIRIGESLDDTLWRIDILLDFYGNNLQDGIPSLREAVVEARSMIQALLALLVPAIVDIPAPIPVVAPADMTRFLDGTTVHLLY